MGDDDWGDDGNEDEIAEEWGGIESSNDEGSEDDHKFKSTTVKNAMHTFPGDHELSRFDFSVLNEDTPEENGTNLLPSSPPSLPPVRLIPYSCSPKLGLS